MAKNNADDNAKFWDWVSVKYDEIADEQVGQFLRPSMLKYLGMEGSLGKVLEIGCGTGYFTEALAELASYVTAIDISDGMIYRARERMKNVKNVTIRKEDCKKTSFTHAMFDTIFMGSMLNVLDDPAQALREIRRVLKPGGTLIIINPDWSMMNSYDRGRSTFRFLRLYGEALYMYPQTFKYVTKNELVSLLAAAGFRTVSVRTADNHIDPRNCALEYVKAVMLLDNVIEVEHLGKRYGNINALSDVSFSVRRGDIFAMVGPNGAGKTTLVEILECRKAPSMGKISVLGTGDLMADKAHKAYQADKNYHFIKERIGMLPQSFRAFDLLTVYENVDYFARMYANHVSVDSLIEEFGLADRRNALFKDLSGGLKQRVGIAIAMVNDPDIVFLDEPTAGLDPRSRRDVWGAIRKLKAREKTVFLTTHYMDEAYSLADRVCILHKGEIVAEGSPEDMINIYGGNNTLVIRDCSVDVRDYLLRAIPDSLIEGNSVLAKISQNDGTGSLEKALEILSAGKYSCKEIYVKKSTLDDVFLNLTGEKVAMGGQ
jgi:ABC-2 type transport system ATP-binding protein